MRLKVSISFLILLVIGMLNLTAQEAAVTVYVYDAHTDDPIENALVTVLWNGAGIDSAYTDNNGLANINLPVTSVGGIEGLPSSISLSNNYPNPFNENTNVEMSVPEASSVSASIYNILGQRVAAEQIPVSAGNYTLNLSLGHLPKGVYFLRVGGSESQVVKLTKMGDGLNYSGPLFSISPGILSGSTAIHKESENDYMLKATKEQYDTYEIPLSGLENNEIAIPLSNNSNEPANDDATLLDLTIDGETVNEFNPDKLMYEVGLPSGTTDVPVIAAAAKDPNAQVLITQASSLPGTGNVEVTAEDEDTKLTYEIIFDILPNKTVVDIDGNVYNTVSMGMMDDQGNVAYNEWMAENLRATHYRNGDPILVYTSWGRHSNQPDHTYSGGRFDISQGIPGVGVSLGEGRRRTAIHWKDFGSGTGLDPTIVEAGGFPDGFLEALEEMYSREGQWPDYPLIDPAMHWHFLGLEGIADYKDGMFLAEGAIPNSIYGAFGAAANLPTYAIGGLSSNEEVVDVYGRVYNWYAVTDPRGLCPVGWRVPSDEEWKQIERYIISEAAPHLTLSQINSIVNSTGSRGDEYDTHNINLGGRMKTVNAGGMEIGAVDGNQGDNFVTMVTDWCTEKMNHHLEVGDKIRLSSYYYPEHSQGIGVWPIPWEADALTVLNIDHENGIVYFDETLPIDLWVHEDGPQVAIRTVWLILESKNNNPVVPFEHPRWAQEINWFNPPASPANQAWVNGGNSYYAGGGSSGLNISPVGWLQIAARSPGWFPEQLWGYGAQVTFYWTSTGYDGESPIIFSFDPTAPPFPYPGGYGAKTRQFVTSNSNVIRRTHLRSDGGGVRCVKD